MAAGLVLLLIVGGVYGLTKARAGQDIDSQFLSDAHGLYPPSAEIADAALIEAAHGDCAALDGGASLSQLLAAVDTLPFSDMGKSAARARIAAAVKNYCPQYAQQAGEIGG